VLNVGLVFLHAQEDEASGSGDPAREPQDQVFEAEEPAGDAAGILRGGGAPVEVGGEPGGGEFAVAPSRRGLLG
jgi:hypothetical protein